MLDIRAKQRLGLGKPIEAQATEDLFDAGAMRFDQPLKQNGPLAGFEMSYLAHRRG
jgi:hypothetical protein